MSQCCCFTIPWTLKVSLSLFFTLLKTDADTVIATSWRLKLRAIRLLVQRSFPIPITWYLCIEPVLWICLLDICITHWGRVTHICVSKLTIISSDNDLSKTSHYLNQCCNIGNSHLRNKFQWNLKRNSYIFIQEIAFENIVSELTAISSRSQCINRLGLLSQRKKSFHPSFLRVFNISL